jgi:hypothetical protein
VSDACPRAAACAQGVFLHLCSVPPGGPPLHAHPPFPLLLLLHLLPLQASRGPAAPALP